MEIAASASAGAITQWTSELARVATNAVKRFSETRRADWCLKQISRVLAETEDGEMQIVTPNIHGVSENLLASLELSDEDLTNVLAMAWRSDEEVLERTKRMCATCNGRVDIGAAMKKYLAGSSDAYSGLSAILMNGDPEARSGLALKAREQTQAVRTVDARVSAVLCGLDTATLKKVVRAAGQTVEAEREAISDSMVLRGILVITEIKLILSDQQGGLYLTEGSQAFATGTSLSGTEEQTFEGKFLFECVRRTGNTDIIEMMMPICEQFAVNQDGTRNEQPNTLAMIAIKSDLDAASEFATRMRKVAKKKQSLLLTTKEMRMINSNTGERSLLDRVSLYVKRSQPRDGLHATPDGMGALEMYSGVDGAAMTKLATAVLKMAKGTKHKVIKSDLSLGVVKVKRYMQNGETKSSNYLEAQFSGHKLNILGDSNELIFNAPYSGSVLYCNNGKNVEGVGETKKQFLTCRFVDPVSAPLTLLKWSGTLEDSEKCKKLQEYLKLSSTRVFKLWDFVDDWVKGIMIEKSSNACVVLSEIMRFARLLTYDELKIAWIQREVISYLVRAGAYDSGKTVGLSCYFDTVRELFGAVRANIAIDLDEHVDMSGSEVLIVGDGTAVLDPSNKQGRRVGFRISKTRAVEHLIIIGKDVDLSGHYIEDPIRWKAAGFGGTLPSKTRNHQRSL